MLWGSGGSGGLPGSPGGGGGDNHCSTGLTHFIRSPPPPTEAKQLPPHLLESSSSSHLGPPPPRAATPSQLAADLSRDVGAREAGLVLEGWRVAVMACSWL